MEKELSLETIVDPYETSIGSMINTSKITDAISKYLVEADDNNLNYEYENGTDTKLVFITGKNDEEQKLPLWEHPLAFQDVRNNNILAVDLRKFVNPKKGDFTNLKDIIRDGGGFEFTIVRTLLTLDFLEENYGVLRNVQKNYAAGFAFWVSTSLTSALMLSPVEKLNVEIASLFYFYMMHVNGTPDMSDVATVKNKILNTKLSLPINKNVVESIVNKLDITTLELDGLVENIKIAVGEAKSGLINTNVVINIISNSWYGPGASETILMGTEHIPTWIAMMFSASNNKTYKKTRLANILDTNKTKLKLKEFISAVEHYVNEKSY